MAIHDLWRHVEWSSTVRSCHVLSPQGTGESQVSNHNFQFLLGWVEGLHEVIRSEATSRVAWEVEEDVVELEVSVDSIVLVEVVEAFSNLVDDQFDYFFVQFTAMEVEEAPEVSSITELDKDVDVVI